MAVPQIGVLAPIAPATQGMMSPLGQIGQAIGQMPDTMQQQQLSREQTQTQLSELDDKRLAQIAQMAQANSAYATHPGALKAVTDIYKRRGLPAPIVKDDQGQRLDVNALIPGKQFGELTPQELDFYASKDPEQRSTIMTAQRIMGTPKSFLSQDASLPVTAGEVSNVLTGLRQEMLKVGDPASAGPEGFAALVKMYAPILKKAGFDPSQLINDPTLQQAMDQRAGLETQKLLLSGILKPEEEIRYKQGLAQYYRGKLADQQVRTGLEARRVSDLDTRTQGQLARWDVQNKSTLGNLNVAQQRLQVYAQMQGPTGAAGLLKYGKFLQTQLGQAQSGLDSLENVARGYTAAFQPVPADIQSRIDALKDQINTLTPMAGAAVQQASSAQAGMIRAQTGAAGATPSGFGSGEKHELERRTIGGATWVKYSDGTYAQVP